MLFLPASCGGCSWGGPYLGLCGHWCQGWSAEDCHIRDTGLRDREAGISLFNLEWPWRKCQFLWAFIFQKGRVMPVSPHTSLASHSRQLHVTMVPLSGVCLRVRQEGCLPIRGTWALDGTTNGHPHPLPAQPCLRSRPKPPATPFAGLVSPLPFGPAPIPLWVMPFPVQSRRGCLALSQLDKL